MLRFRSRLLISILLILISPSALHAAGADPVHGQHAMVVSVHELASRAGVEVMQAGGNAVDAAVATGFALAVVYPAAGNIGGGGFMLFRRASGEVHFLDYREMAPAKASANMYLDPQGNIVPGMSVVGYKAIAVPGSVAGMVYAERRWGKLSLKRVMQPAIRLAREGYKLSYGSAWSLRAERSHLAEFPESRRIFQRNGDYFKPGEAFRQPELAQTLERIAANPDDFYHGHLARELAAALQKGGGLITVEDLAAYQVKEREPLRGSYRRFEVISAPLPSSGGVALVEILNILEGYDLAKLGNRSADSIHLVTESFRRAFDDRAEFLGDPDFSKIPVPQLIDKKYGAAWRESLETQHASPSQSLHRPRIFDELNAPAQGDPAMLHESANTTHYSVVDSEGNAVAVTTTLNGTIGYGSAVTAEGLGFLLNDEMEDFTSKVGVPNLFGLIQGPANAIGPGKRPLSAMTPTIVVKDGKLFLVLGSPGGPRIITTVANILMGVVDFGLDIQQAVNAPRFHHQWLPDTLYLEQVGFSPDTIRLLQERGHTVTSAEPYSTGYWSDGECIQIDFKTGERLGATDIRNDTGAAVGY